MLSCLAVQQTGSMPRTDTLVEMFEVCSTLLPTLIFADRQRHHKLIKHSSLCWNMLKQHPQQLCSPAEVRPLSQSDRMGCFALLSQGRKVLHSDTGQEGLQEKAIQQSGLLASSGPQKAAEKKYLFQAAFNRNARHGNISGTNSSLLSGSLDITLTRLCGSHNTKMHFCGTNNKKLFCFHELD